MGSRHRPLDGLVAAGVPRLYHSIALLLPDGRVLTTGGNGYTQSEIYSPPYLFAGARPSISSVPASVGRGQSFVISTPDATAINAVAWVRLPSVTHTNGMSQGFFRTTAITQVTGGIQVTAPNHTSVPSGHYMLFVLRNGVPSVAKIVNLGTAGAPNPVPALASMTPDQRHRGFPSVHVDGQRLELRGHLEGALERGRAHDDVRQRHGATGGDPGRRHRCRRYGAGHGRESGARRRCVRRPTVHGRPPALGPTRSRA